MSTVAFKHPIHAWRLSASDIQRKPCEIVKTDFIAFDQSVSTLGHDDAVSSVFFGGCEADRGTWFSRCQPVDQGNAGPADVRCPALTVPVTVVKYLHWIGIPARWLCHSFPFAIGVY